MTEVAFKSDHEAVVAALEEWHAMRRKLHDDKGTVARELDPDGGRRELLVLVTGQVIHAPGLRAKDSDKDHPPKGWRPDWFTLASGSVLGLVPDKRTKIGKAAAEVLRGLRTPSVPDLPGLPKEVWERRYGHNWAIHYPHIVEHGGTIFVRWGADPRECGFGDPDSNAVGPEWTEVKMSEFYLALEAEVHA